MIKVLRFDNDDVSRDRFAMLYQGLCLSTKGQSPRDLRQLKREGALRKRFESISTPKSAPTNRFQWVEREPELPADIEVDQEDLELLRDYCIAVSWTAMVADLAADAIEWSWGAPEKERLLKEVSR